VVHLGRGVEIPSREPTAAAGRRMPLKGKRAEVREGPRREGNATEARGPPGGQDDFLIWVKRPPTGAFYPGEKVVRATSGAHPFRGSRKASFGEIRA
jgi:hypothetical protein